MMSRNKDLPKQVLYESVKTLWDCTSPHIHLNQQKLFTLTSIAFQYLLYKSTKNSGIYLLRVEDSYLLDKLIRKSKDDTTRKFIDRMALPRRLKYQNSTFILDYFNKNSWSDFSSMPSNKLESALIIRNTTRRPFEEIEHDELDLEENSTAASEKSKDQDELFFYAQLQELFNETISIAYGPDIPNTETIRFDFIKEEEDTLYGVKIAKDLAELKS